MLHTILCMWLLCPSTHTQRIACSLRLTPHFMLFMCHSSSQLCLYLLLLVHPIPHSRPDPFPLPVRTPTPPVRWYPPPPLPHSIYTIIPTINPSHTFRPTISNADYFHTGWCRSSFTVLLYTNALPYRFRLLLISRKIFFLYLCA